MHFVLLDSRKPQLRFVDIHTSERKTLQDPHFRGTLSCSQSSPCIRLMTMLPRCILGLEPVKWQQQGQWVKSWLVSFSSAQLAICSDWMRSALTMVSGNLWNVCYFWKRSNFRWRNDNLKISNSRTHNQPAPNYYNICIYSIRVCNHGILQCLTAIFTSYSRCPNPFGMVYQVRNWWAITRWYLIWLSPYVFGALPRGSILIFDNNTGIYNDMIY